MPKTMLENIFHDALALMEGMRDYVREDARRDREALEWKDREVIIRINRLVTVRLCHALQLIQAHRERLAGSPTAQMPRSIRLAPVPVGQSGIPLPPRLEYLCQSANHLFERLQAVHLAVLPEGEVNSDGSDDRSHGIGSPPVAEMVMPEACARPA